MNRHLLQLLGDNARADKASRAIRADASGDVAQVYVYDVIDGYWGASAKALVEALAAAGDKHVDMHINSPGGDVFEARAMVSAVRAHQAKGHTVTAYIDGLAASAATYLALSGDTVNIAEGGMFMVHNSWTLAWGNKSELRSTADLLEKIDGTIAADYQRKTGAKAEQVIAWMNDETWFTAEEAAAAGFVDNVIKAPDSKDAKANRWNLSAYAKAPKLSAAADGQPAPKDDVSDALNARQAALYDAFEQVVEDFGPFDQTSGPAGAHYMAANPFAAEGMKCANCALYAGQRRCEVVSGDIDPEAVCKLWIIPEGLLAQQAQQQQAANTAADADRALRLNRSRLAALLTGN